MNQSTVVEFNRPVGSDDPLMALLQSGARQLLQQAVEAELQEFLSQYSGHMTDVSGATSRRLIG